jgi:hypothetical protein
MGLLQFPTSYPQLALWAAFLRRFAAKTAAASQGKKNARGRCCLNQLSKIIHYHTDNVSVHRLSGQKRIVKKKSWWVGRPELTTIELAEHRQIRF